MTCRPYPYFACLIAPGEYTLEVTGQVFGPVTVTITINEPGAWHQPNDSGPQSLLRVFLDALNAQAGFGGTWGVTHVGLENARGIVIQELGHSVQETILEPGASGTPFDLRWLGFPQTLPLSDLHDSTTTPMGCWFPKAVYDDRGWLPSNWAHGSGGPTAGGASFHVNHQKQQGPQWRVIMIPAGSGVYGARMQRRRAYTAAWANAAGVLTGDPFVALDAHNGFWECTVRGEEFMFIADEEDAVATAYGPCAMRNVENAPINMAPWFNGLREPNVNRVTGAHGRRGVEMCWLEEEPVGLKQG